MALVYDLPKFTFSVSSKKMVSTNDMYFHVAYKRKNTGRMSTHAVKTKELQEMQDSFIPSFKILIDKEFVHECVKYLKTKLYGLSITTEYYMPLSNYEGSDVSNYIKAYEDCISYALKEYDKVLDDKNNLEYLSYKYCNSEDVWRMVTTIKIIPRDKYYRSRIIGKEVHDLIPTISGICPVCNSHVVQLICIGRARCNKCNALFKVKGDKNG